MRYCPRCGMVTASDNCPADGTPTVRRAQAGRRGLQAGDVIGGRYRIVGELGRGGFGVVFGAVHVTTGHSVAVKVLTPAGADDGQELARRFFQEASATSRLSHPNTVRVFDFGQTDAGDLFLAMERLDGETLLGLLTRVQREGGVLSEAQTVEIGGAVLRSLGEAHAHGLVHRDMKPANIFLHQMAGGDSIVKVLDFGIVKQSDTSMTQVGKALGTPTHMSPEQAMGRAVDARTDLYALGVVLYECLTGTLPFDGENPLAVVMQHVTEPVPPIAVRAPGKVRPALAAVVEKALAKRADDRWPNALDMRLALQAAVGLIGETGIYGSPGGPPAIAARTPPPTVADEEPLPTPLSVSAFVVPVQTFSDMPPLPADLDDELPLPGVTPKSAQVLRNNAVMELPPEREPPLSRPGAETRRYPDRLEGNSEPKRGPEPDDEAFLEIGAGATQDDFPISEVVAPLVPASRPPVTGRVAFERTMGANNPLADRMMQTLQEMSRGMPTRPQRAPARPAVSALASENGRHVLIGEQSGAIRLVDLDEVDDTPVQVLDLPDRIEVGSHASMVGAMAQTPDGRWVVSAGIDGVVRLWDPSQGNRLAEVVLPAGVTALAVSTDSKLVIAGGQDGAAYLLDLPDLATRRVLRGHREAITAVAAAGSRRLLVTASEEGSVRTWDPVGGGARLTWRGHEGAVGAVALTPNALTVISGGWDGRLLAWSCRTGESTLELQAHQDVIAGVAIDRSGTMVATASDDRSVRVWRLDGGQLVAERRDFTSGVKLVRFAEDGRSVLVGCWDGTFLRLVL